MLKTERTCLRLPRLEDAQSRYEWFNNPEFTRLYLGRSLPVSFEQTENEVKFSQHATALSGHMELSIQALDGDRYIGNTFFRKINWQDRHAEFGIFIGIPELCGTRLGTEVTRFMLDYGFKELGLHRIWLTVFPYNHRAMRCFEKCGFKKEAVFREVIFGEGQFHDVIGMSVLEGEI